VAFESAQASHVPQSRQCTTESNDLGAVLVYPSGRHRRVSRSNIVRTYARSWATIPPFQISLFRVAPNRSIPPGSIPNVLGQVFHFAESDEETTLEGRPRRKMSLPRQTRLVREKFLRLRLRGILKAMNPLRNHDRRCLSSMSNLSITLRN
jgi:hypothetical protein